MKLFRPLLQRPVALLWGGLALSSIGDELFAIAVAWMAVQIAGTDASWLSALRGGAALAGALLGGIWAERWDHRRTMIGADLTRAGLALLPMLAWTLGIMSLWMLAVPVMLMMIVNALFEPALRASLPRIVVASDQLQAVNALFDAIIRVARVIGPMLAAAITLLIPLEHLFTLNSLTFLISAWAVMKLSKALPRQPLKATSRRAAFTAGWRSLVGRRQMQAVYVCAGLGNIAWSLGISIGMALAVVKYDIQGFGVQDFAAYGLIMGAYGCGNLISIFVVGNLHIHRLYGGFTFGSVVNGLGIATIGAAVMYLPAEYVLAGMMFGAGLAALGGPLIDISFILLIQTTFRQSEIAGLARLRFAALGASILIAGACGAALYARFETGMVILGSGIFEVIVGAMVLLVPKDNEAA
ncbi:MFS transporter [Pseudomonas donghuensis]|uniref:MFS transporter n=1 Tax=Pseudomonas donghuensis TaxID=1163398 RepID=UPI00215E87A7|nr:MFS transporter [Pseudomonas donghuensis]UVL31678.1 MFS transporter [Pseudomonas donghuensis]